MRPSVSVIVPVYNSEKYLGECLDSLLGQSIKDIEVICVNDASTDSSPQILDNYAKKDSRLHAFTVPHNGAGAARNRGMEKVRGEYIYFFDSDDIACPDLLEKTAARARETGADIVAFHGYTFESGDLETKKFKSGYSRAEITDDSRVFSYRDFGESIMSVINVVPWNKLYRADFVKGLPFGFDEISSSNDIAFSALSAASAEKIAVVDESLMYYRVGHEGTISSGKTKNLDNIIFAVESIFNKAKQFARFEAIAPAVFRFAVSNYCFAFKKYCTEFCTESSERFYRYLHDLFNRAPLDALSADNVGAMYQTYRNIQRYDFEQMNTIVNGEIIVSLTTYPKRIATIHKVVENLCRQTKKADKILLWLAEEDFENRLGDLPAELLEQQRRGMVEIRFCENLLSHKKYFYTMQEYPDSVVITVDDDLVYPKNMIALLYASYVNFPDCISAMRAHIITVNPYEKEILPYEDWIKEYKSAQLLPSMQLFATSGAGTLYPPHLLNERLFDKKTFMQICKSADDIWLNAMGVINGVPTVPAASGRQLKYIEGTQEDTLYRVNVGMGQNTKQFADVQNWLAKELGYDAVYKNITTAGADSAGFITYEELFYCMNSTTRFYNRKLNRLRENARALKREAKALEKRNAKLSKQNRAMRAQMEKLREENKFSFRGRVFRFIKRMLRKLKKMLPH